MKQIFLLAACLSFFAACNNPSHDNTDRKNGFSEKAKTPEDSLFQLVLDGHDFGMGKMGKIKGYQQQAIQALDSVSKLPESATKKQLMQTYLDLKEDLAYAENSMDSWMTGFNPDSAKENAEARIKYLTGEKAKVDKVKESILTSLQRADSIFKK
ncbi:hypothetical protein [Flavihumibacter profundi]|uniref:hypothetical protein n=1 Tax=Flavihumibacter profundi TaxID=2716883 RepID=UPI001CC37AA6|nr:hypothetical protein [Flavihumibacter profundi]MBZ5857491.1 hypothetical protein [Flavihumibacter profundi]